MTTTMNKEKALEQVLKDVKKIGDKLLVDLSGDPEVDQGIEWMPSGSMALDAVIGKGLPRGRVIEMFGPEGSGKSSNALLAIAANQKLGGISAYVDMEGAYSTEWASRLGVNQDPKKLLLVQPDYGEQALDLVADFIKSNVFDIIVIDSVASLVPKAEIEGTMEDKSMGLQARMMGQALRKLAMIARKSKTTLIFINQTREAIGVMYGNPETTPGGKALKFYASVRIRVSRVSKSDVLVGDETVAHRVAINVVKNKVSAPFKKTEFLLHYDLGPDNLEALAALSMSKGIVQRSGPSYALTLNGEERSFFGQEKLIQAVKDDKELRAHLIKTLNVSDFYLSQIA